MADTPAPSPELAEFKTYIASLRKDGQISDREERLMGENAKLRDKLRRSRTELEETGKKLPTAGARVLTADEAKTFDAFTALKLKPEEITAKLSEHEKSAAKLAEREAADLHASVAELLDVENPKALQKLLARENLVIELRDVRVKQDDGSFKNEQVPFARKRDDEKAQLEPLADYIDRELPEFVPSLMTAPEAGDEEGDSASRSEQTPTTTTRRLGERSDANAGGGTPFPRRSTTSTPTSTSKTEKAKTERLEQKRANPIYQL